MASQLTLATQRDQFERDVLDGLSATQKTLPSRWLYDDAGSELFEQITTLEEYYPTRTETAILETEAATMAAFAGARPVLIEYGAGAGRKTEILLAALDNPAVYVPVDIAEDFLHASVKRIENRFPYIEIVPVTADISKAFDLPANLPKLSPRCGFFPGSTIGNLSNEEAETFLKQVSRHVGETGTAIIGFDLVKPLDVLLPAYDDAAGVTEAFNKNLLVRINRELDGTFDSALFDHEARWNDKDQAVEMHLVSAARQDVRVAGQSFSFGIGETIHTESSRKYSIAGFKALAARAGWTIRHVWSDKNDLFAVVGLGRVHSGQA